MSLNAAQRRRAGGACGTLYLVFGLSVGTWAARVADVRAQTGISVAVLGASLLAMGAAALITAPLVPLALSRLGPGVTLAGAVTSVACGLALVGLARGVGVLIAGFALLGAGQGLIDVAASATGIEVERILGTPRLSAWHGWYQFALLGGAILAACAALAAVSVGAYFATSAAIVALFGVRAAWELRHVHPVVPRPSIGEATGPLVRRIAVMSMLALYAESAATGWAVVFMKNELSASSALAAIGFAMLPLTLGISRVQGDRAARRVGSRGVLVAGSLLAGTGLVLLAVSDSVAVAVLALALYGIGAGPAVPLLYRAAGAGGGPAGLAKVITSGYVSYALAAPITGLVAGGIGLRGGMLTVTIVMGLLLGMSALRVVPGTLPGEAEAVTP